MRLSFASPLHPIFVHFTIALTSTSLVFDALDALVLRSGRLSDAGWWTVVGALAVTPATLVSGLTSRMRLPMEEGEARSFLRLHMALGPVLLGFLIVQVVWRARLWERGGLVDGWYLAFAASTVALMAAQGYLGGELVYRFGAEVRGAYRRLPVAPDARPE
jgi:uncharacterized membrane protein